MINRRTLVAAATGSLAAAAAPTLFAQEVAPLARILVGFPPGGSADAIGRALAERLRGPYAQTVVVDNKPGALAAPVMQALLQAPADGNTIYLAPHSSGNLFPHVYEKLPYDPSADVIPVSLVGTFDFALSIAQQLPVRTVGEFVQWAKSHPERAAYGSLGNGTVTHFMGFVLSQATSIKWSHVPYKGAAPGVLDLVAGHIPSLLGPLGDIAPYHKAGRARVIATTGSERSRFLPEVPTFEELGIPGLVVKERFGIWVRRGTARPAVMRLNAAIRNAVSNPDFRAVMDKLNYEAVSSTPEEFASINQRETVRWGEIVKSSGFQRE